MAKLLTNADLGEDIFSGFASDKERIKYMSKAYANMSIAKSFSIFYNVELSNELKSNRAINQVTTLEIGKIYAGSIKTFTKDGIVFDIPGVKDEIICRENLYSSYDSISNYLLTHNNKIQFEVRENKNNKFYVSVINAYYKAWVNMITEAIKQDKGIQVHIDSLVKGGYMCHTEISTLTYLTGVNYTHSVFIPGSHIVLNIEKDFEKWVGQDVIIVPQKFVEYRKDMKTGITENSLVGSRKRVLQIYGTNNMNELYCKYILETKDGGTYHPEVLDGIVTGIINSNKKTGIFIEIKDKYITGLLPIKASQLLDYKPGDGISVYIKEFEVQDGKEPFIYNKHGLIMKSNTRPVFALVE